MWWLDSAAVDFRLELVQVPVSDVDRAKAFYTEKAGFNADVDITGQRRDPVRAADASRVARLDRLGIGLTEMAPGTVKGMQLVVDDIKAARAELVERGVDVSEVQVFDWGSFVFFSDPDGNGWAVQQLPVRD